MKGKDVIIIKKIIDYINDVEKYIQNMEAKDFFDDKKTMTASAFSVSQIGELSKEISDEAIEEMKDIPWKSIKGMRNKIVHDYDNVDLTVLWGTITLSLPELKIRLKNYIDK